MDQKTPLYQQKNCDILVISVKIFYSRKNPNIRIPIPASLMPKCTYIYIFWSRLCANSSIMDLTKKIIGKLSVVDP